MFTFILYTLIVSQKCDAHSLYTSYPIMTYFKFFILNLEGEIPSRSPDYSALLFSKAFLYNRKFLQISYYIKRSAKDAHSRARNYVANATALGARISLARFFLILISSIFLLRCHTTANMSFLFIGLQHFSCH